MDLSPQRTSPTSNSVWIIKWNGTSRDKLDRQGKEWNKANFPFVHKINKGKKPLISSHSNQFSGEQMVNRCS